MGEFSDLRARTHDENRQVVERRVYAVTGQHLPEDDIDRMIETGGCSAAASFWTSAGLVSVAAATCAPSFLAYVSVGFWQQQLLVDNMGCMLSRLTL